VTHKTREAFLRVCDGYSADRVIADPVLNERFLHECRQLGLNESPAQLNAHLLNARKSGLLADLSRAKRTSFADEEEYRFASEVAARFIEHRGALTVDQVICDPKIVLEFDALAARIAPGYTPLQYRWAALNLRKSKRLRPESIAQVVPSTSAELGPIDSLDPSRIPSAQGIYIFYSTTATLYIGETANLRKRIGKHLDHSDNRGLAHWFWENGFSQVHLEIRVLPEATSQRVRSALERELIMSRKPVFNIQHK
jgi:predicted GIY-YIG superfamily endonuclease